MDFVRSVVRAISGDCRRSVEEEEDDFVVVFVPPLNDNGGGSCGSIMVGRR